MLTPVDPSTTPAPQGGYTQGARVDGARRWLFISGQTPAATPTRTVRSRREVLGDHHPALTVVLAGIYDQSWLLEIEAVAAGP